MAGVADILIRRIDQATKELLRRRAERRGKSLEADLRETLEQLAQEEAEMSDEMEPFRFLAGLSHAPRFRSRRGSRSASLRPWAICSCRVTMRDLLDTNVLSEPAPAVNRGELARRALLRVCDFQRIRIAVGIALLAPGMREAVISRALLPGPH
jgi:hypothetical protein